MIHKLNVLKLRLDALSKESADMDGDLTRTNNINECSQIHVRVLTELFRFEKSIIIL